MDKIYLKSKDEIAAMVKGGRELSRIRNLLIAGLKPGIKTIDIEKLAEEEILKFGGQSSFKTVKGYHHTVCVTINEEVVHGVPGDRVIKKGDKVGIDIGMIYRGLHTDTAWTTLVKGEKIKAEGEVERFLKTGEKTLEKAIKAVKIGRRVGQISQVIQKNIEEAGYSVVKILTGHGVGRQLHEEPMIPQFLDGAVENTPEIKEGMTLAIEVIYNLGTSEVALKNDGWTIVTQDGKISATFERSIAVFKSGVLVLTP